jgi:flagellar hook-length control protein FliK
VVNQTNILSILPAPTVGNAPLTGDIANLGDSSFQNYMKDAVKESSVETKRSERPENRPADDSARPKANEATDSDYQERIAVDNETDRKKVLAEEKTQNSEVVDSNETNKEQAYTDINALLQSLAQQLNLSPDDLLVDATADPLAQQQKLLSLLQSHGDQAAQLLAKAGLTEEQAQNLLSKIQLTQGGKAQLQASKEGADDVLVKLSGEKSAQSKADFLSQFSDFNKQGDKPQRQASIEKVLTQSANEPVQELSQKPLEKNLTAAPKLEEAFQASNNQTSNPLVAQNAAANSAPKNATGFKLPTEVQVQSVNAVSESAARTVEGAKSVSAETLSAKGTTEARVINQIINKVSLRSNGSQSEIKIRLDPPSLGTLRMNVTTSGDSVRTVIIADNHAAKQIIENNLLHLKESMQSQGLKVDSFTVLVGGNEGQGGQQNTPHEGRSNFAGLVYGEQNSAPESTPAETLVAGRTQVLNYDSKSLSVFA